MDFPESLIFSRSRSATSRRNREFSSWSSAIRSPPRRVRELQCKSETLDSFHLAPDFLKIDVQGWEYNVLIGAKETLAQHEPVLLIEIYDDPRIDALLHEYGDREYFLNKGRLVAGRGPDPLNLLFVTARRIAHLGTTQSEVSRFQRIARLYPGTASTPPRQSPSVGR
jgi:hypothetical protein